MQLVISRTPNFHVFCSYVVCQYVLFFVSGNHPASQPAPVYWGLSVH